MTPCVGWTLRLHCKTFIKLTAERPVIIVLHRKLDSIVPSLHGIYKPVTASNYFQLEQHATFFVFRATRHVIMQSPTVACSGHITQIFIKTSRQVHYRNTFCIIFIGELQVALVFTCTLTRANIMKNSTKYTIFLFK